MEKPVVTLSERKCVPQKVPPHGRHRVCRVAPCRGRPRADVMMLCAGSSSIRRARTMGRQHCPRAALREPPFLGRGPQPRNGLGWAAARRRPLRRRARRAGGRAPHSGVPMLPVLLRQREIRTLLRTLRRTWRRWRRRMTREPAPWERGARHLARGANVTSVLKEGKRTPRSRSACRTTVRKDGQSSTSTASTFPRSKSPSSCASTLPFVDV